MTETPARHPPEQHRSTVIILAFAKDDPRIIDVFRCRCGEHGAYFPGDVGMMSINEDGWIPFAWRPDDAPARDDVLYPPMWEDYLTKWQTP